MKKTFALFVFLFAAAFTLEAQNSGLYGFVSSVLTMEKDTARNILLRDSVTGHFYPDWESDSTMLMGLKAELGEDADFMLKQRQEFKAQVWDASKMQGVTLLGEDYYKKTFSGKKAIKNWEKFYSTHKTGYYELSMPVFSRDGKTAVLYLAYFCGNTCGHGGASLYRFENGKWQEVRSLFSWIKN